MLSARMDSGMEKAGSTSDRDVSAHGEAILTSICESLDKSSPNKLTSCPIAKVVFSFCSIFASEARPRRPNFSMSSVLVGAIRPGGDIGELEWDGSVSSLRMVLKIGRGELCRSEEAEEEEEEE